jgi:hypothetical protein
MQEEIDNLVAMGTWQAADLPVGRKAIPSKWVFKRKLTATGSIERYRARLVLQGFRQVYGIDYSAVFAPVVRASTVRLFFSIVASQDLECHSVDIKNAFVQSDLVEEIYMKQPPCFDDGTGNVYKLNKSLYGLKQAPRVWNQTLAAFLQDLGFNASQSDGALFLQHASDHSLVYLLLYVDDILIASSHKSNVECVKQALLHKFPGRDLGETSFFLQMSVVRDRDRRIVVLRQRRHIEKLVDELGLSDQPSTLIPMTKAIYADPSGQEITDSGVITQYRSIIGMLMHIANFTRPDVSFAASYLARFVNCPTTSKFARVRDVIRYLNGTSTFGLYLGGPALHCPLYAYCDSDFAACTDTRKSTTGYVVQCGLGSVCWKSVRQATVSRSTPESEYIAAGEVAKELQYIHALALQMGLQPGCIPVGIDNEAALRLIQDPLSVARTKHIDVIYHHIRERVNTGQMNFISVSTDSNCADLFTKPLPRATFEKCRCQLGVHDCTLEYGGV